MGRRSRWLAGLIAITLLTTGCASSSESQERDQPQERRYTVRLEQTDRRSGPAGEINAKVHLVATIVSSQDQGGKLLRVVELLDQSKEPLPPIAAGTSVRVTPAGEVIVDPGQYRPALSLILRLTVPLMMLSMEPRIIRHGPQATVAVERIPGARRAERARRLDANRSATTVTFAAAFPVVAYWRDSDSYRVHPPFSRLVPAQPSVARPTRVETYRRAQFWAPLVHALGCAFSFGQACGGDPPKGALYTQTVVVDGPRQIETPVSAQTRGQVSQLVYERGDATLLRAEATGHDDLGGKLPTGAGIPAPITNKPVRITSDWHVTAELSSEWPDPPRSHLPLVLIAVALLLAASAAAAVAARSDFAARKSVSARPPSP